MRKLSIFILSTLFLSQHVLADNTSDVMSPTEDPACRAIVKTCLSAGYIKEPGKQLWLNCMKPILLGQDVASISFTAETIQTCRNAKIVQLKQDLQDLQTASKP